MTEKTFAGTGPGGLNYQVKSQAKGDRFLISLSGRGGRQDVVYMTLPIPLEDYERLEYRCCGSSVQCAMLAVRYALDRLEADKKTLDVQAGPEGFAWTLIDRVGRTPLLLSGNVPAREAVRRQVPVPPDIYHVIQQEGRVQSLRQGLLALLRYGLGELEQHNLTLTAQFQS